MNRSRTGFFREKVGKQRRSPRQLGVSASNIEHNELQEIDVRILETERLIHERVNEIVLALKKGVDVSEHEHLIARMSADLGIRWTIGDASHAGYEALRLSVHGAKALFGSRAEYLIVVNKVSVAEAQRRAGSLPPDVVWRAAEPNIPDFLRAHLDAGMAEGVAWKFAPVRAFPGRYALALDNDVILWELPTALRQWLESGDRTACVIAEDVTPAHGKFADFCGPAPRNSGIRGIGPDFDFEAALEALLRRNPVLLESELDEQGLQIAALSWTNRPLVVSLEEVTICSPFYPHLPHLGRCGAHFVGINVRNIPWSYYGQPATELRLKHWRDLRAELYRRVGLEPEGGLQEVA